MRRSNHGFTIVELLIVVVVIAILAAIVSVAYNGVRTSAQRSAVMSTAKQGYQKIQSYSIEHNEAYPQDLPTAGLSASDGYEYTVNNSSNPKTFCLTTTKYTMSYYVSNENSKPTLGTCPGHTGGLVSATCPDGYILVPGNPSYATSDFCVMKYEAKNVGGVATSNAAGTPWVSISQTSAITQGTSACSGCRLISEAEWMTIAANVLTMGVNWSTGVVGSGYMLQGHVNNNPASALDASLDDANGLYGITGGTGSSAGTNSSRVLTLTNGEAIWDFTGNVSEWTSYSQAMSNTGYSGDGLYFYWRNWFEAGNGWTVGNLPVASLPSSLNGSPGLAGLNWHQNLGVGQIYTRRNSVLTVGFIRGGHWSSTNTAGVVSLVLDSAPNSTSSSRGFRLTVDPN